MLVALYFYILYSISGILDKFVGLKNLLQREAQFIYLFIYYHCVNFKVVSHLISQSLTYSTLKTHLEAD